MCRSRASGGRLTQASRLGNASKIGPFFLKYAVPISQKTCRATLALDKLSYNGAGKRASALTEAFEELEPCLVGADDTQKSVEASEFSIWLQAFLRAQTRENRVFFVRRYWYGESVGEIAAACGCSAEKVKSSLFRTRNRLREAMLKEDIAI